MFSSRPLNIYIHTSNLTYISNFLHWNTLSFYFFFFYFFLSHTDPFIRDHAGVLPLHLAASAGMVSALRLLIKSTVTVGRVPWWKNEQVSCFFNKFIVFCFLVVFELGPPLYHENILYIYRSIFTCISCFHEHSSSFFLLVFCFTK